MSATRRMSRLGAVLAGVVVAVGVIATRAEAAEGDVAVRLSGVASSVTAGGRPDTFSIRLSNETKERIGQVRRVIVIELDGLTTDGVVVARGNAQLPTEQIGPGLVRAVDYLAVDLAPNKRPGSAVTEGFAILFTQDAPAGRARITAEAWGASGRLGSDSDNIRIRAQNPRPGQTTSNRPTPTTTPPTVPPPVTQEAQPSLAPLEGVSDAASAPRGGNGLPTTLYLLGGVLVAMGGAIIWLLVRRPATDAGGQTGAYPVVVPYQPAHSAERARRPLDPTAILPTVRPAQQPPAVDPWAKPQQGSDDFDPFQPPKS